MADPYSFHYPSSSNFIAGSILISLPIVSAKIFLIPFIYLNWILCADISTPQLFTFVFIVFLAKISLKEHGPSLV